jgi:hypothetical protein
MRSAPSSQKKKKSDARPAQLLSIPEGINLRKAPVMSRLTYISFAAIPIGSGFSAAATPEAVFLCPIGL